MWLGKLTALDMTPLGWLSRKTSTQSNKITDCYLPYSANTRYIAIPWTLLTFTSSHNCCNFIIPHEQTQLNWVCYFVLFIYFFFFLICFVLPRDLCFWIFNSFKPSWLLYHKTLDWSISKWRDVWLVSLLPFFTRNSCIKYKLCRPW